MRTSLGRNCVKCGADDWYHYPEKRHKTRCAPCQRKWQKENGYESWDYALQNRYGITEDDYHVMLEEQDGTCGICNRPPGTRRLQVDHCHDTGKVRGLLCPPCNRSLGIFGDNLEGLKKAMKYLEG